MSADGHMRYYLWLLIITAFNSSLYKKMNQCVNKITRNWSLNFNTGPRANKDSWLLKWSRLVDYLSRGRGAVVFWGTKHQSLLLKMIGKFSVNLFANKRTTMETKNCHLMYVMVLYFNYSLRLQCQCFALLFTAINLLSLNLWMQRRLNCEQHDIRDARKFSRRLLNQWNRCRWLILPSPT